MVGPPATRTCWSMVHGTHATCTHQSTVSTLKRIQLSSSACSSESAPIHGAYLPLLEKNPDKGFGNKLKWERITEIELHAPTKTGAQGRCDVAVGTNQFNQKVKLIKRGGQFTYTSTPISSFCYFAICTYLWVIHICDRNFFLIRFWPTYKIRVDAVVQLAVANKKIQVSRWKRSKGNWKRESAPAQLESVPQRLEKVRNFLLLQAPPIRLKCDASIYE